MSQTEQPSDQNQDQGRDRADELARVAYHAYGQTTGWKNFRGDPMPIWEDLGHTIQAAWRAAAAAVADQAASAGAGEAA